MKDIKYEFKPHHIMRYFLNHIDYEKDLINAIHKEPSGKKCLELFRIYKNEYMRIGRNFKSGNDVNILNELLTIPPGYNNVEELSQKFNKYNWLNNKIENAIVASSKFLWLVNRDVIIIDSVNAKLLGVYGNDYKSYCNRWNKEFAKAEPEISRIISYYFSDSYFEIMNQNWFKMRVFDQYLWTYKKNII